SSQYFNRETAVDLVAVGVKPVIQFFYRHAHAVAASNGCDFNRIVVEPAINDAVFQPGHGHPHVLEVLTVADSRLGGEGLLGLSLLKCGNELVPAAAGFGDGGFESWIVAVDGHDWRMRRALEQIQRATTAQPIEHFRVVNDHLPRGWRE